uniref:Preferentially expressed antigen in melanoma n=1 Tax=Loxodonta africana TaxID=9785 RepID=G3U0S1_LOXAF
MNSWGPPRLLDLANQSLLRDEALAIAALRSLPTELFPPLFKAAVAGRHSETLKAMVQAWPFTRLPLGALMKARQCRQDILRAALDGVDVLLAQKFHPRRGKLKVLDLRANTHTDFWNVWSGTGARASVCLLEELRTKKKKVAYGPMEVLIDLCLDEAAPDQLLTFLIKKVKQRKGQIHLCCRKLNIVAMPLQNIEKILKTVQLDCVQEVEVNCTWELSTLARFAPHLGQMVNLTGLRLSHIYITSLISRTAEDVKKLVAHFTSQLLNLNQLQELHLGSILFLEGHLDQVLRCLKTPLETLFITNCLLLESDLTYLCLCLSTSHLSHLNLSDVNLTGLRAEFFQVLLARASATLHHLDLHGCGITDSQLTAIMPALGQCSQLHLQLFWKPISTAVLESLLWHILPLSKFRLGLFPVPLECYMGIQGTLHLGNLKEYMAKLRQTLQELRHPNWI